MLSPTYYSFRICEMDREQLLRIHKNSSYFPIIRLSVANLWDKSSYSRPMEIAAIIDKSRNRPYAIKQHDYDIK